MTQRLPAWGILVAWVILVVAVTAAALAIAMMRGGGCAGTTAALDGTDWTLVRWSESGLDPADFTITADFAEERISGLSAVSNYGGPYRTGPGDEFSIGPLSSTMLGGMGAEGRAERVYFDRLKAAVTFSREGDTLTLFDESGDEALVFKRAPAR